MCGYESLFLPQKPVSADPIAAAAQSAGVDRGRALPVDAHDCAAKGIVSAATAICCTVLCSAVCVCVWGGVGASMRSSIITLNQC